MLRLYLLLKKKTSIFVVDYAFRCWKLSFKLPTKIWKQINTLIAYHNRNILFLFWLKYFHCFAILLNDEINKHILFFYLYAIIEGTKKDAWEPLKASPDLRSYKRFLYRMGIAENSEDFSPANSIPLEYVTSKN